MIDWFKKHRVLFALICVVILLLLMGVPFVINILFKINATTDSLVSNNIAYTVDVYDIKIKGGSKTIWESDDTYGAPVINPQKEMTIQTKSPATNETGEFTLFATMSCMDKYDGKHEYILIRAARQTPGRSPADSAESSFLGHHRLIAARRAIPASGITYPA